jgi:hypothetical protein
MLTVLGTVAVWYVGDAFYNDYAGNHAKLFEAGYPAERLVAGGLVRDGLFVVRAVAAPDGSMPVIFTGAVACCNCSNTAWASRFFRHS